MARRKSGPRQARVSEIDLTQLVHRLEDVGPDTEYELTEFRLSGGQPVADRSVFVECAFVGSVAETLSTRHARLVTCVARDSNIMTWNARGTTWREATLAGGRVGSFDLSGASLDTVQFVGLRIGYLNLVDAELADVRFTDCVVETLDLPGASLERVSFRDCVVDELDLRHCRSHDLDLRGLAFSGLNGVDGLRGATVTEHQCLQLASVLATAAGIAVVDDHQPR